MFTALQALLSQSWQTAFLALRALRRNKLRSSLTALGIILGVGTSQVIGMVSSFQAIVTADSILLAFGVSFVIGVFFGYYPARKAAALDPIDALRYE